MKRERLNDPGYARRGMQTRYDDYMRGDSLILGIGLRSLDMNSIGTTEEAREQAIEKVSGAFPRKTQELARRVTHELIFLKQSAANHFHHVNPLIEQLEGTAHKSASFGYISGLGRNACMFTQAHLQKGAPQAPLTIITRARFVPDIMEDAPPGMLIVDADYGMGDLKGPTPTVLKDYDGDENLMLNSFRLTVDSAA